MRLAFRLLADVKSGTKFLEAGTPTGLTGLFTHPSPRSTLLYLYGATLDHLKAFPEYSVYRQSTEALTKHRQSIIEQIKPAGYDEWAQRAQKLIEEHPKAFEGIQANLARGRVGEQTFVRVKNTQPVEEKEWDGEINAATLEGSRTESEGAWNARMMRRNTPETQESVEWEPEPPLNEHQIEEAEQKIGAGLIEEVVQVAEGELELVKVMAENKVWEELEEKPAPGQWEYFQRGGHMPTAQEPAK